jgi:hypothetical protein
MISIVVIPGRTLTDIGVFYSLLPVIGENIGKPPADNPVRAILPLLLRQKRDGEFTPRRYPLMGKPPVCGGFP